MLNHTAAFCWNHTGKHIFDMNILISLVIVRFLFSGYDRSVLSITIFSRVIHLLWRSFILLQRLNGIQSPNPLILFSESVGLLVFTGCLVFVSGLELGKTRDVVVLLKDASVIEVQASFKRRTSIDETGDKGTFKINKRLSWSRTMEPTHRNPIGIPLSQIHEVTIFKDPQGGLAYWLMASCIRGNTTKLSHRMHFPYHPEAHPRSICMRTKLSPASTLEQYLQSMRSTKPSLIM